MADLDPLYTYAGFSQGSHFIIHFQQTPRPEDDTVAACCQVFNALIQDQRVARDDRLLAFVIRPESVLPVSVTHADFNKIVYPNGAFASILTRLGEQRFEGERLVVKETVLGEQQAFLLYLLPANAITIPAMGGMPIRFAPLREAITTKPIPYL